MISIITYDSPHRKTQDLIFALRLRGYSDIHLAVLPWIERANFQPLYKHRPGKPFLLSTEALCERSGLTFHRVAAQELDIFYTNHSCEHILIGGAGLLPTELAVNHQVINGHPGYLPQVKGLDALKWAILEDLPIGVTTHFISGEADGGLLIAREKVEIQADDTFHSLAYRVYETEINMLADAIAIIDAGQAPLTNLDDPSILPHRRMPHAKELEMMQHFNAKIAALKPLDE
jgi:phosphoribosylglycinamide formyltransferase-1